eukprot:737878-Amphidinium_carterae.2
MTIGEERPGQGQAEHLEPESERAQGEKHLRRVRTGKWGPPEEEGVSWWRENHGNDVKRCYAGTIG